MPRRLPPHAQPSALYPPRAALRPLAPARHPYHCLPLPPGGRTRRPAIGPAQRPTRHATRAAVASGSMPALPPPLGQHPLRHTRLNPLVAPLPAGQPPSPSRQAAPARCVARQWGAQPAPRFAHARRLTQRSTPRALPAAEKAGAPRLQTHPPPCRARPPGWARRPQPATTHHPRRRLQLHAAAARAQPLPHRAVARLAGR